MLGLPNKPIKQDNQKYNPVWLVVKSLAESTFAAEADSVPKIPLRVDEINSRRSINSFKAISSIPFSRDKQPV